MYKVAKSCDRRNLCTHLSRGPIQRRIGSSDEVHFLILRLELPITVSTAFRYPVEPNGPPLPKDHPGRMRQGAGGMIPRSVCGVDRVEVGHKYEVSVCNGLAVGWWRWGTKEEVQEPEGSRGSLLGWSETKFVIEVEDGVVEFEVVE